MFFHQFAEILNSAVFKAVAHLDMSFCIAVMIFSRRVIVWVKCRNNNILELTGNIIAAHAEQFGVKGDFIFNCRHGNIFCNTPQFFNSLCRAVFPDITYHAHFHDHTDLHELPVFFFGK